MSFRRDFRESLGSGVPVYAPLCLDALTARICEKLGFGAGYLGGGALGFSLAVSEALVTITEVASVAASLSKRSRLPMIVDGGVGFGDALHATRMVWELEMAGAAAIELEDQVAPKRVLHHKGIEHLVPTRTMVDKVRCCAVARTDPDLLIIARTGAVHWEGFSAALARCESYLDAGADLVLLFPKSEAQWEQTAREFPGKVVAMEVLNVRSRAEWAELGYSLVIDPWTTQVVALEAMQRVLVAQVRGDHEGPDLEDVLYQYEDLPELAGLPELYEIELATVEDVPGAGEG